MKREYTRYTLIAMLLMSAVVPAFAASASDLQKKYLAKIDELMPGMGAEKIVDREKSQMEWERICLANSGPDQQADREAICAAMMERVGPDVPMPARVWLLRKATVIGREEVVARLAELMNDPDALIREEARRAMENNPVEAAAAALRKELEVAKDNSWRVALINALAYRRDVEAVPMIDVITGDSDEAVAKAAITALGTIANAEAVETLGSLRKEAPANLQGTVADASIRAAEALVARGDNAKAAAIYEELFKSSLPESTRIAALRGIAAAKDAEALPELLPLIAGNDVHLRMISGECVQNIPGEAVTERLADALADMPTDGQVVLLDALGRRGDKAALPAVLKLMNASSSEVRIAALNNLRHLGDGSTVETLAAFAAKASGEDRDVARWSLQWMRGQDVDDAILKMLPTATGQMKSELIWAAASRFMKPAFEMLLQNTHDADESVRVAVISSIGQLAKLDDLNKVLKAFENLEGNETCGAAKSTLIDICQHVADKEKRAQPLVEAIASAAPSAQVVILQALEELRGPGVLEVIRQYEDSGNAEVKEAAGKAITAWGPIYCMKWVHAGPYKKDGETFTDLFDIAFPPEADQGDVEWEPLNVGKKKNPGGRIDLEKLSKDENCCVYFKAQVQSKTDQEVVLAFGSDDGIKVWLNGSVVHANNTSRGCNPGEDQVSATLKQGWNTLLIKVTQGSGNWAFSCGIKAPQGGPPPGLKFKDM